MDRALLILCALLLNATLGGPRSWYAALGLARFSALPAAIVRDAERRLNRQHRSLREREVRGMLLVAFAIIMSVFTGWILGWLFKYDLQFVELIVLAACLPVRPTWDRVSHIRKRLQAGDAAGAKQVLEGTLWRHHAALDEYGVARAGIELLAVNFSEKIAAPALWYALFGLPGLFISKSVYLLLETLARPGAEEGFARAAETAHALLHYVPSRLAAVLWLAASLFLPNGRITEAAKQLAPAMGAATPQEIDLLAAAGVLNLALGGPSSVYVSGAWMGSGTARPVAADVRRALRLFALLHLLLFVLVGLFL